MTTLPASSQSQLRQYIEQIERLEEERKALVADIGDKFLEAKAMGFDPKIMRKVLAIRRKGKAEREEEEAVLETYLHALGMLAETPLGQWAQRQAMPVPSDAMVEAVGHRHGIPREIVDEVKGAYAAEAADKASSEKRIAQSKADKYISRGAQ